MKEGIAQVAGVLNLKSANTRMHWLYSNRYWTTIRRGAEKWSVKSFTSSKKTPIAAFQIDVGSSPIDSVNRARSRSVRPVLSEANRIVRVCFARRLCFTIPPHFANKTAARSMSSVSANSTTLVSRRGSHMTQLVHFPLHCACEQHIH